MASKLQRRLQDAPLLVQLIRRLVVAPVVPFAHRALEPLVSRRRLCPDYGGNRPRPALDKGDEPMPVVKPVRVAA